MLKDDLNELGYIALIFHGGALRVLFNFEGDDLAISDWNVDDNQEWVAERLIAAIRLMIQQKFPVENMWFGSGFIRIGTARMFTISFIDDADKVGGWSMEDLMQDSTTVNWAKVPEDLTHLAADLGIL